MSIGADLTIARQREEERKTSGKGSGSFFLGKAASGASHSIADLDGAGGAKVAKHENWNRAAREGKA